MRSSRVRVLVVDDSATVRSLLTRELGRDSRLEVVGAAEDAYRARDMIVETKPDVITLDLAMPRMDGLEFIEILMKHWPIPIVVLSSIVEEQREKGVRALELGAVEVFAKPRADDPLGFKGLLSRLVETLLWAARVDVTGSHRPTTHQVDQVAPTVRSMLSEKIIAIGASTGGTEALRTVLTPLPISAPGIVIVQHMPEHFTRSFAERLNHFAQIEVKEAEDGDEVFSGRALLAPGDHHLQLHKRGNRFVVSVSMGPLVSRHRPSVDVLFHSVAEAARAQAVGIILTGMGSDGAKGMLAMKNAGARTIAQSEETCVVFGMPREALANGGAEVAVPLTDIPAKLMTLI